MIDATIADAFDPRVRGEPVGLLYDNSADKLAN
jgi:hypothetical protein